MKTYIFCLAGLLFCNCVHGDDFDRDLTKKGPELAGPGFVRTPNELNDLKRTLVDIDVFLGATNLSEVEKVKLETLKDKILQRFSSEPFPEENADEEYTRLIQWFGLWEMSFEVINGEIQDKNFSIPLEAVSQQKASRSTQHKWLLWGTVLVLISLVLFIAWLRSESSDTKW